MKFASFGIQTTWYGVNLANVIHVDAWHVVYSNIHFFALNCSCLTLDLGLEF